MPQKNSVPDSGLAANLQIIGHILHEKYLDAFKLFENQKIVSEISPFTKHFLKTSVEEIKPTDQIPDKYAGKYLHSTEDKEQLMLKCSQYGLKSIEENEYETLKSEFFDRINKCLQKIDLSKDLEKMVNQMASGIAEAENDNMQEKSKLDKAHSDEETKATLLKKLKKLEQIEMIRKYANSDELLDIAYLKAPEDNVISREEMKQMYIKKYIEKHGVVEKIRQT